MEATYKIEKLDEVMTTLSVTMTVKEWGTLMEQLPDEYPSLRLYTHIRQMIYKANLQFKELDK